MLSETTQKVTDAALWLQVQDVVRAALDRVRFDALTSGMADAAKQPITGDVEKVVDVTAAHFKFDNAERGSVLRHLIAGGDLTRYGMMNAITRTAEDATEYDRATEVERLGIDLVELPPNTWKRIAEGFAAN